MTTQEYEEWIARIVTDFWESETGLAWHQERRGLSGNEPDSLILNHATGEERWLEITRLAPPSEATAFSTRWVALKEAIERELRRMSHAQHMCVCISASTNHFMPRDVESIGGKIAGEVRSAVQDMLKKGETARTLHCEPQRTGSSLGVESVEIRILDGLNTPFVLAPYMRIDDPAGAFCDILEKKEGKSYAARGDVYLAIGDELLADDDEVTLMARNARRSPFKQVYLVNLQRATVVPLKERGGGS